MSVESGNALHSAKAVHGAHHASGKRFGKADAGMGGAVSGFSALMDLLSASDPSAEDASDSLLAPPGDTTIDFDKNQPPALMERAQTAINLIPDETLSTVHVAASHGRSARWEATLAPTFGTATPMTDLPTTSLPLPVAVGQSVRPDASASLQGQPVPDSLLAGKIAQASLVAIVPDTGHAASSDLPVVLQGQTSLAAPSSGKPGAEKLVLTDKAGSALAADFAVQQRTADPSVQQQVDTLLGFRSASGQPGLHAVRSELREVKTSPSPLMQATGAPDVLTLLPDAVSGDMLFSPQERRPAKSATGQTGSGFEGTFGAASASQVHADAAFEIAPAAAVVPEAAIAETVSQWAMQGVQSAELTLEGFGGEPIEVRILLNGDQAQIDFRTNQADVRQVLEAATAQLKELLSGEGLQLTGVSVGFAGANTPQGDGRRQPSAASKEAAPLTTPPEVVTPGRNLNPSAGHKLDLFV